ncbi:hypothetical protein [Promicromonospora sukumoe]|uniref:hypothetical protein n=1 Tax=Promicromonospora sukumoe TaxID=88382 RepID=UPI0018DB695D|nr:hypothetical protein [Promicromonospora sukumoe]
MQQLTSKVAGACDAWLTPRLGMFFRPAAEPITTAEAKLGGQPVWLETPQWPLSRTDGAPMMFIGQFPVPQSDGRIAYLFMSAEGSGLRETWDSEAGENAVIIQPGGRVPDVVRTADTATGPTLWTRGPTWDDEVPVELHVDLTPLDPATDRILDAKVAEGDAERRGLYLDPDEEVDESADVTRSYVGGAPVFWQPHLPAVPPDSMSWRFFLQLDGAEGIDDDPYALNFGGGTAYVFLSRYTLEGRLTWDCV